GLGGGPRAVGTPVDQLADPLESQRPSLGETLAQDREEVLEQRLELRALGVRHAAPCEHPARGLELAPAQHLGAQAEPVEQIAQEPALEPEAEWRHAPGLGPEEAGCRPVG